MRLRNITVGLLVLVGACEKNASEEVVEEAKLLAKENSLALAQLWRIEHSALYGSYDIFPRGDSTISPKCPQGDGWASIDLIETKTGRKIKLKCSTYSRGNGCMTSKDFKSKRFASQENRCSTEFKKLKKIKGG